MEGETVLSLEQIFLSSRIKLEEEVERAMEAA